MLGGGLAQGRQPLACELEVLVRPVRSIPRNPRLEALFQAVQPEEWAAWTCRGGGRQRAQPQPQRQEERRRHRSEEHTSELQSHSDLVCRLLLEKKKKQK